MQTNLNGLGVVVTRPARQGRKLADLIRSAGGQAIEFPTLKITAVTDTQRLRQLVKELRPGDWAIFISANAAEFGSQSLEGAGVDIDSVKTISIGAATSAALNHYGLHVDLECPAPAGSESLLAMPEMHKVKNQRIFIFRGIGGRELLGQTLGNRGALVRYIECYERRRSDSNPVALQRAEQEENLDVMVTTSVDGLKNLVGILTDGGYDHLLKTSLVVIGQRQHAEAKQLGWRGEVLTACDASNEAILNKLQDLVKT
ncbi:MAG: uroporphyrinogen-III synthase [Arenicellales bacterium]|nr:uroporphyrinogen-III synthase [Arenicellales bacterium]